MLNALVAVALIAVVVWSSWKVYDFLWMAEHPDALKGSPDPRAPLKEMKIVTKHLERWRDEGRLSREAYEQASQACEEDSKPVSNQQTL